MSICECCFNNLPTGCKITTCYSHPDYKLNQSAKSDEGKLRISLVPTQVVRDIAEVREYGCIKYKDPDNWKKVEPQRYVDALLRHTLAYIDDKNSVDEESGIKHLKHMACNIAFLCEMEDKQ